MGTVARQTAYAAAGAEPRPDAPIGSVRWNPRPSKAVNDHDIVGMVIWWIGLKFYLNRTWPPGRYRGLPASPAGLGAPRLAVRSLHPCILARGRRVLEFLGHRIPGRGSGSAPPPQPVRRIFQRRCVSPTVRRVPRTARGPYPSRVRIERALQAETWAQAEPRAGYGRSGL